MVRSYIKIFPHKSVTKRNLLKYVWVPVKVLLEYWVAVVKPGRVMFEIGGVTAKTQAREAMRLAAHKLPIKCKFPISEKIAEKGGEA